MGLHKNCSSYLKNIYIYIKRAGNTKNSYCCWDKPSQAKQIISDTNIFSAPSSLQVGKTGCLPLLQIIHLVILSSWGSLFLCNFFYFLYFSHRKTDVDETVTKINNLLISICDEQTPVYNYTQITLHLLLCL